MTYHYPAKFSLKDFNCQIGILAFLILLAIPFSSRAMIIEMKIHTDQSALIDFWFNSSLNSTEKFLLEKIEAEINRTSSDRIKAKLILDNPVYENTCLKVYISDIRNFRNKLNFIDYHFTRSFFLEKYYLKIFVNSSMFESNFFYDSWEFTKEEVDYSKLVYFDDVLKIVLHLPGRCLKTNLTKYNSKYFFLVPTKDFEGYGSTIFYFSHRFIPEAYFTTLTGLILLILAFLSILKRK